MLRPGRLGRGDRSRPTFAIATPRCQCMSRHGRRLSVRPAWTGVAGPWRHMTKSTPSCAQHVVAGCRRAWRRPAGIHQHSQRHLRRPRSRGVDESAPYAQHWLLRTIPHSKALAEQHVLAASGHDGLLCCALRPHLILGPRDRQLVPRLLACAAAVVDSAASATAAILSTPCTWRSGLVPIRWPPTPNARGTPAGRAYFISQGEPVNCWQWIDALLGLAGLPPVNKSMSLRTAWANRCAALELPLPLCFGLRGEPPMTRSGRPNWPAAITSTLAAARRDFGYEPRISTAEV